MSWSPTTASANSTTIAQAASQRDEFSTLAAIVKAANLVDTLASPGPFTVFAPTDAAFSKLPQGEVDRLLRPENHVKLTSFVACHILAGQLTVSDLRERAQANAGRVTLRNVDGDTIGVEERGDELLVVGARGAQANVTFSDLLQSNGVIHVTDSVLSAPVC